MDAIIRIHSSSEFISPFLPFSECLIHLVNYRFLDFPLGFPFPVVLERFRQRPWSGQTVETKAASQLPLKLRSPRLPYSELGLNRTGERSRDLSQLLELIPLTSKQQKSICLSSRYDSTTYSYLRKKRRKLR
jgi:hypothetical protein